MEQKLTLTVREAAALSGIGRDELYRRADAGELPVIRVGRKILIHRHGFERWLEAAASVNMAG